MHGCIYLCIYFLCGRSNLNLNNKFNTNKKELHTSSIDLLINFSVNRFVVWSINRQKKVKTVDHCLQKHKATI